MKTLHRYAAGIPSNTQTHKRFNSLRKAKKYARSLVDGIETDANRLDQWPMVYDLLVVGRRIQLHPHNKKWCFDYTHAPLSWK